MHFMDVTPDSVARQHLRLCGEPGGMGMGVDAF